MENLQINGLTNNIAYLEAIGLSKCFEAYANYNHNDILDIGFNANSGYVYISLEENIVICSMLGRDVEYLVTDFDNGEEFFFDTIEEARSKSIDIITEYEGN